MNFAEKAFVELFPDKKIPSIKINYSGKFNLYGANVRRSFFGMEFGLSKAWRGVSEPIKIGLIQSLLLKTYRAKGDTINIDLYESFTKNIQNIFMV
jgi:hypothetical protein